MCSLPHRRTLPWIDFRFLTCIQRSTAPYLYSAYICTVHVHIHQNTTHTPRVRTSVMQTIYTPTRRARCLGHMRAKLTTTSLSRRTPSDRYISPCQQLYVAQSAKAKLVDNGYATATQVRPSPLHTHAREYTIAYGHPAHSTAFELLLALGASTCLSCRPFIHQQARTRRERGLTLPKSVTPVRHTQSMTHHPYL